MLIISLVTNLVNKLVNKALTDSSGEEPFMQMAPRCLKLGRPEGKILGQEKSPHVRI